MGIPNFRQMRADVERMRAQKDETFPLCSMVKVDSERFHGIGYVVRDESCPLEKLAVRVESLNVWWYPVEDCQPFHGQMPGWIRRHFRQFKMRRVDSPYDCEFEVTTMETPKEQTPEKPVERFVLDHRPCIGESEDDDSCKAKMGHSEAGAFVYHSEYAALLERVALLTRLLKHAVEAREMVDKCSECGEIRAALKGE